MPDRPFGSDSLAAPAYLAKGDGADDPGLAAWKQEHPNWVVVGNWTPTPSPARIMPPTPDQGRATVQPVQNTSFLSPDPATMSVADFRRVADKPREPTSAPAGSNHAYPDNPLQGTIPDIRATEGYVSRLSDGKPVPDHTQTDRNHGMEPTSPTDFVTTPHPDNGLKAVAADQKDE